MNRYYKRVANGDTADYETALSWLNAGEAVEVFQNGVLIYTFNKE